jgi:hypothetical protein
MSQRRLVRMLSVYEKDGEERILKQYELANIDLAELQRLFSEPEDEPMYDSYIVQTKAQAEFLNQFIDATIDVNRYDFFVECFYENVFSPVKA